MTNETPPVAVLGAGQTKNELGARQPLPDDVVEALHGYLNGKPAGRPVWTGTWHKKAAEMLGKDLDAAGIPYAVQGPDGPLFADSMPCGTPSSRCWIRAAPRSRRPCS